MTTGEKIRYFREKLGITQTQLANEVGVHPVSIRKYETDKNTPNFEHLVRIANIFNVSPNALAGKENLDVRLYNYGDLLALLFLLLDTGALKISGTRSNKELLDPATITIKLERTVQNKLSMWERADYLLHQVEQQKTQLPPDAFDAAYQQMQKVKDLTELELSTSQLLLNRDE